MTGFEFSAHAKSLLKKYYMREGEDNPKDAFRRASYFYARDSHLQRGFTVMLAGLVYVQLPYSKQCGGKRDADQLLSYFCS